MSRTLKPATSEDVLALRNATILLRTARDLLASAGADNTVERVRAAIKSADGALRHVQRRAGLPDLEPPGASRRSSRDG